MSVTREDVFAVLSKAGLTAKDVIIQSGPLGKSAPGMIAVIFSCEADSLRLLRALRASTSFEIGHGKDSQGDYVVTMFGSYNRVCRHD